MYHWPGLEAAGGGATGCGAFVTVGADATIRTWDHDTGRCRATLADHSHAITCMVLVDHAEGLAVSASEAFHDKLSKAHLKTVPHPDYHADIVQEFARNKEVLDADDEVMAAPEPELKVWNLKTVTFHRPSQLPFGQVVDAYAAFHEDDVIQIQDAEGLQVLDVGEDGEDAKAGKKMKKKKKKMQAEAALAAETRELSEHQKRNAKLKERLASLKQY
jgi:hypothetical protein